MAPLPTITDVYRCEIVWPSNLGIQPVNVFHVRASSSDAGAIGAAVGAASEPNVFYPMSQAYDASGINVTALDGHSASVFTIFDPGTMRGQQTGSEQIAECCAIVTLRTAQRGSRGRGRMFVGPIVESTQANGHITSATSAAMATAWGEFISALATDEAHMVVASYLHADAHDVDNFQIQDVVGIQKRRRDQLLV